MWGTSDTTVKFCEKKYARYYWIAEYHNTVSALCYMVVGFTLMRTRLKFLGWLTCLLSVCTMLLHGTLRHLSQMGDEMSMLLVSFYTLVELRPATSKYLIYPILMCYCALNRFFLCFLCMFVVLQFLIFLNVRKNKWIILSAISATVASFCWVMDQLCITEEYQMHAWWHFFTALGMGIGYIGIL